MNQILSHRSSGALVVDDNNTEESVLQTQGVIRALSHLSRQVSTFSQLYIYPLSHWRGIYT
jgi:hypothetical protein